MSDRGQRKWITAKDNREQAGGHEDGKDPSVEQPLVQLNLPLAGRELQFLNVDNSDLFHTLRRSMATKNFSVPDGDRWPASNLNNASHHLKAIAQLKPDPTEVEPFLHEAEISEWQERTAELVRSMDDLTADVLDIIFATWLKDAFYPESTVVVTADDCLRHRGLNPKKGGSGRSGGYHTHQRQEIARHIDMLQNTRIRVFEREVTVVSEGRRGPERKRVKWAGEGPVIIVTSRVGPVNPSGDMEPRAWKIRPGDVFGQFLLGPGRQTALISQMALHYDPYRQYWEKRITRFLAYLWRIRGSRNDYLAPISVSALLQGAGLQVNKRNPKKTRSRLEKALGQLSQDGVIRSWRYVAQVNEKPVSRKGWSKAWVSWKVQIEPPRELVAHYSKMSHTLPGKKALPAPGQ